MENEQKVKLIQPKIGLINNEHKIWRMAYFVLL